jgi:hypothetical protein
MLVYVTDPDINTLEDGSYNFVYGETASKQHSQRLLRVGKGSHGHDVLSTERGIKHFQLCSGKNKNGMRDGPLLLIYAGVLHKRDGRVLVTPLSGRWNGLKTQVLDLMNRKGDLSDNPYVPKEIALLSYTRNDPDMQDFIIDMLLTGMMVEMLRKKNKTGLKFDPCWHMMTSRFIAATIHNQSDTPG